MIGDLRAAGRRPAVILLSPYDKNSIKEELIGTATEIYVPEDRKAPTLDEQLAFIEGIPVVSHPDCIRGRAKIVEHKLNG